MTAILEKVLGNTKLRKAAEALAAGQSLRLHGLWGSSAALAAAAAGKIARRPVLFVTAHLDDADDAVDDLEVLAGLRAHLFPAWDAEPGADHVSDEVAGERLRLCNLLCQPRESRDEAIECIVAPMLALLQPVPTAKRLAASRLSLERGVELGPEALTAWLVDAGFERVDQVEQQGDFARRGGIVDVFPPGSAQAVRVEFFGDQIESIRRIDLDTQRSTAQLDGYDLMALLAARQTDPAQTTHLLNYLPSETVICMVEPDDVFDLAAELHARLRDMQDGAESIVPRRPEEVFAAADAFARLDMLLFGRGQGRRPAAGRGRGRGSDDLALNIRSLQKISLNTHEALVELGELSDAAEVWVFCENPAEKKRFGELLAQSHPKLAGRVRSGIGHVRSGFHWPDEALIVVGHHEIFHRYAKLRRIRRVRAGRPIESLLDLREGDYVVHVAHGIARFEGLQTLQREGRSEEYLRLRFADRAVLNVPTSKINLVQRYIGSGPKRPSLSKLGGSRWAQQKQRVSAAVLDMASEMLRVQAVRQAKPGLSYPAETDWQRQFAGEFVYAETEDQIGAMQQLDADMAAARPMDRLLCGDVGYGKTELAMRAAFKVAEQGKQVAVLVPTTVLAEQHHRTFAERFADYPFRIAALSRLRRGSEQVRTVEELAGGKADIVIGTHRLLSKDVHFADLGLVVIDEEQRFGVEHKEHLKSLRATVDVLTMTATPIPRTLHMALLGLRDISSLATPPLDRRAIHTEVRPYDDAFIRQAILRELSRDGQVFFVHNRVFDIDGLTDHIRSQVPEARVAYAHGQMPARQLERTMLRFVRQEINVLVCTTIIESGLDIPTANTMIIHEADRFGLAELHQLRGRVGRYKHRAYCYLLLPERRTLTPAAAKRLKAIEDFSDLGAGFQIAMRDLEIRGAGNMLGREQSGHIAAVGYELYCQLLEAAVRELRGEPAAPRADVHVELGIDAYVPKTYVPSSRQRMEIYRRLVSCRTSDDLEQLSADLADAYGPVPPAVTTLLDLAEVRVLAAALGIESIIRMDPDIIFAIRDFSAAKGLFEGASGTVRLPDEHTVHWRLGAAYLEMPTLLCATFFGGAT
jgi:transcription-repair coupling factor (superfamily II helicase)